MQTDLMRRLAAAGNDPRVCEALLKRLEKILSGHSMRFMEVCGTHTVSIFQSGLRCLLPASVTHLSGPGCPVCVTHEAEIALLLSLANNSEIIIATFGDLLRVPGSNGQSLKYAKAKGADVRIVYSPLDAVAIAVNNPDKQVIFAGIGFETTAPTVAAAILKAQAGKVANFSTLSFHKLVAPALKELLTADATQIDAFLLPGHVAAITGLEPFIFLADDFHKPAIVGGFEPADILLALCQLAESLISSKPVAGNAYQRVAANEGNPRARALLNSVFRPVNAKWRGLGIIPASGLAIRPQFSGYDAMAKFGLNLPDCAPVPGCLCGKILKGDAQPPDCPLFAKRCAPANPVGPCMVSTEGSCAAWYKYGDYSIQDF